MPNVRFFGGIMQSGQDNISPILEFNVGMVRDLIFFGQLVNCFMLC
jgi:hypothetical protein